ncbi:uncharacterized protein LOC134823708 [Bolinopsis microptera]|uniref:uncharacterized protein LOC134823708 n=1 Tax=Bolinopsis microptera TaxID=2820187 RepID=UPI00307ABA2C
MDCPPALSSEDEDDDFGDFTTVFEKSVAAEGDAVKSRINVGISLSSAANDPFQIPPRPDYFSIESTSSTPPELPPSLPMSPETPDVNFFAFQDSGRKSPVISDPFTDVPPVTHEGDGLEKHDTGLFHAGSFEMANQENDGALLPQSNDLFANQPSDFFHIGDSHENSGTEIENFDVQFTDFSNQTDLKQVDDDNAVNPDSNNDADMESDDTASLKTLGDSHSADSFACIEENSTEITTTAANSADKVFGEQEFVPSFNIETPSPLQAAQGEKSVFSWDSFEENKDKFVEETDKAEIGDQDSEAQKVEDIPDKFALFTDEEDGVDNSSGGQFASFSEFEDTPAADKEAPSFSDDKQESEVVNQKTNSVNSSSSLPTDNDSDEFANFSVCPGENEITVDSDKEFAAFPDHDDEEADKTLHDQDDHVSNESAVLSGFASFLEKDNPDEEQFASFSEFGGTPAADKEAPSFSDDCQESEDEVVNQKTDPLNSCSSPLNDSVDDFCDFAEMEQKPSSTEIASLSDKVDTDGFADFATGGDDESTKNEALGDENFGTFEDFGAKSDDGDFSDFKETDNRDFCDFGEFDSKLRAASTTPEVDDDFGDFGDFDSKLPAASTTPEVDDDFGDFGDFDTKIPAASTTLEVDDDFGDFGDFDTKIPAASTTLEVDDDFGDFGDFDSKIPAASTTPEVDDDFGDLGEFDTKLPAASTTPAVDDDFGDFGDFDTKIPAVSTTPEVDDDFGDFGDFDTKIPAASTTPEVDDDFDDEFADFGSPQEQPPPTVKLEVKTGPLSLKKMIHECYGGSNTDGKKEVSPGVYSDGQLFMGVVYETDAQFAVSTKWLTTPSFTTLVTTLCLSANSVLPTSKPNSQVKQGVIEDEFSVFGSVDTTDTSNKLSAGLLPEDLSQSSTPAPSKKHADILSGYKKEQAKELSSEAAAILDSLPDLKFMLSSVLMFPVKAS